MYFPNVICDDNWNESQFWGIVWISQRHRWLITSVIPRFWDPHPATSWPKLTGPGQTTQDCASHHHCTTRTGTLSLVYSSHMCSWTKMCTPIKSFTLRSPTFLEYSIPIWHTSSIWEFNKLSPWIFSNLYCRIIICLYSCFSWTPFSNLSNFNNGNLYHVCLIITFSLAQEHYLHSLNRLSLA